VSLNTRIRDRIVNETGGNPLALLELARGLGPRGHGYDRPAEWPAARTCRSLMGGPVLRFAGRKATELSEAMFAERC
jgi:hypothetical protein